MSKEEGPMVNPAPKRKPGRPPTPMPEPIPDTPENILKALLATPPKKREEWDYLKKEK